VNTQHLAAMARAAASAPRSVVSGRVRELVGGILELEGIEQPVGSELDVGGEGALLAEVIGFRGGRLLAAPLGSALGVHPGARVRPRGRGGSIAAGDAVLGRVLDPFGAPLDGRPPPAAHTRAELRRAPPSPFRRRPITRPFATSVRAIDALLPLGEGQRVGLFAGAGVGKSTLLGMMCQHATVDVVVVGLIGERGREVGDFVRTALGAEGLRRSVVVAATGDTPPAVRVRGALAATALAEHFRDAGKRVLLVLDSLTRFAMALRETSLAAGEPAVTKGYTPTVFAALPALLERAGNDEGEGTLTAVYTVLVEGDDLSDPIADAARSILDGHIVLARSLADRGIFPAIDVLRSISRVAHEVAPREQMAAVGRLRDLLAAYEEAQDLVRIGSYVAGSDPRIDAARAAVPEIEAVVRQGPGETVTHEDAVNEAERLAERYAP
jgi:flagellum-specific ATP synthase